jgi:hypothetical protein
MKKFISYLNRVLTIINAFIFGLAAPQVISRKKLQEKKIPVWANFLLFFTLSFLVFCLFYAPYLREKAA